VTTGADEEVPVAAGASGGGRGGGGDGDGDGLTVTVGRKGQGMDHKQGGSSVEESCRDYELEYWVLSDRGRTRLPPTGGSEYPPKHGEILVQRDPFTGVTTFHTKGAGVTKGMVDRILDQQVPKMPPAERPATRPARPAGTDEDGHFVANDDTPDAEFDRQFVRSTVPPAGGVARTAAATGGAAPMAMPTRRELIETFESKTSVRVDGVADEVVTFNHTDLLDYARLKYPGVPSAAAVRQAEQDLTRQFHLPKDEATFHAFPDKYDAAGVGEVNHGINNLARDEYIDWATKHQSTQGMPDGGDAGFTRYPGSSGADTTQTVWDRVNAGPERPLERTFPRTTPDPATAPVEAGSANDCRAWDAAHGGQRGQTNLVVSRTPEVEQILKVHPELEAIDARVRAAYGAATPWEESVTDKWGRFQEELGKTIDVSSMHDRELLARWTYYVLERRTGTPPWFRADGT
jgi:hypothetical protein